MAGREEQEAASLHLQVVLHDGTAASYRLVPIWESYQPQPAGGHTASASGSADAEASLPASEDTALPLAPCVQGLGDLRLAPLPPPLAAGLAVAASASVLPSDDLAPPPPQVEKLTLTMTRRGECVASIPLLRSDSKHGSKDLVSVEGNCYVNVEIHPGNARAAVRLYTLGTGISWKSTSLYSMVLIFGGNDGIQALSCPVYFHAKQLSVSELDFPPLMVNFSKHFTIEKHLGQGTEGIVYRCVSTFAPHKCAVKEVDPQNLFMTRLDSEPSDVGIIAMLKHKNIIELYMAWSAANKTKHGNLVGSLYVSMKPCVRSLMDYLNRRSALPIPTKRSELARSEYFFELLMDTNKYIFRQLVSGLAYLHELGIIHRDVKPGNVLIEEDFTAKITDFGIAKVKQPSHGFFGSHYGSLPYCAPELSDMYRLYDEKVDIFSAGMIYYELYLPCLTFSKRMTKLNLLSTKIRKRAKEIEDLGIWAEESFDLEDVLSGTSVLDDWRGNLGLLKKMIIPNKDKRPSALEILELLDKQDDKEQ